MKIIELQAENVKKISAVCIRPKGNLVELTGENGSGKTSVLDAIWWALCGATNIQGNPIKTGEKQAKIQLDMGEFIITRTFKRDDNRGTISSIRIEDAGGTVIRQPQTMLDQLLGHLSFDPLAFARMTKREQFEQLQKFVPDVDFVAIEEAQKKDYDYRTNLNKKASDSKVLADKITIKVEAGQKEVNEADLVDELEKAGQFNANIQTRKGNRKKLTARKDDLLKSIGKLQQEMVDMNEEVKDIEAKFKGAKSLPDPIDTADIKTKISKAKEINEKFVLLKRKQEYLDIRSSNLEESKDISERMIAREKDKQSKIASAKLPVKGIGFGDNEILIDKVPFNQASDAEQLQVSIAMAMAFNPRIKVIRVRDGSLLDAKSMKMLGDMADKQDYQVWIETVHSSSSAAVVLEEGKVKATSVVKKEEIKIEHNDVSEAEADKDHDADEMKETQVEDEGDMI